MFAVIDSDDWVDLHELRDEDVYWLVQLLLQALCSVAGHDLAVWDSTGLIGDYSGWNPIFIPSTNTV